MHYSHAIDQSIASDSNEDHYTIAKNALINANTGAVLHWIESQDSVLLSTSFSKHSSVLLHLIVERIPNIPVLWVDTGYNTESTYRYIEEVKQLLNLNLFIYHPLRSAKHRESVGDFKQNSDPGYEDFSEEVKLEPFKRALRELGPAYWITGVRREETDYRRTMKIVSPGPENVVKVAPLLEWTEAQLDNYIDKHRLPSPLDYYDPTKTNPHLECGLQTRI